MSFSAWGERRLPANWNEITIPTLRQQMDDYTTRGFTGHEMVDAFGIINMGGRLYDAALGRMLQADPFVQDPTNTQSFNRYSYVFNNPLSYTDPSGYFSLRQIWGIAVGISLSIVLGPAVGWAWAAFISGFVSGAIITGSLKGALVSGLTSLATAGILRGVGNFINKISSITEGVTPTTAIQSNPLIINSTTDVALNELSQQSGFRVVTVIGHELIGDVDKVILSRIPATIGVPIVIESSSLGFDQLVANLAGSTIAQLNFRLAELDLDIAENTFEGYNLGGDLSQGTIKAFRNASDMLLQARQVLARELATKQFIKSAFINTITVVSLATGAGSLVAIGRGISAKIIGTAQATGTRGHAFFSKLTAYRYALDPRVSRVTLDLGYKRLLGGGAFRYGPRPDVGVLFRSGRLKIFEIASKTDNLVQLALRNEKWLIKIGYENLGIVKVYRRAVYLNKFFPK
jgi:RHS repeat-associated protein